MNVIQFPPTQQEKLEAMLEERVPGSQHLRQAYKISRSGREVIVALDDMSEEEVGAIAEGLRVQALKDAEDADRLRAELARREGQQ
jgi:hypothetical protein